VLSIADGQNITNEELSHVSETLISGFPEQNFELESTNNVSAYFSKKFLRDGILSITISAVLIIVYVWFSFRKIHGLSAGVMALLSLLHDILVVFFTFIVFRIPIGDSFIAVALTILGYSINDTIVIYDRIRENSRENPNMPVEEIVDKSISQSFTRSLNTNFAVFVSVTILYVFALLNGLDSVSSFALPMAIGSISGCYSTVCYAGPLWALWQKRKQDKQKKAVTVSK
jgi:preprotein translocase SecF subunit